MIARRISIARVVVPVGIAVVLLLSGGVAGTPVRAAQTSQEPLVLRYAFPAGQLLRYQATSELRETTEVMGRTNETVITSQRTQSLAGKGQKDGQHVLGVTIDDWTMTILTSQGNLSPDLKSVKGRSFDMVVSPLGQEVDVSGAESITFEIAGNASNVAASFKLFFPDLPDKPVRIGDSWPSQFVIGDEKAASGRRSEVRSENTVDAFETVDGRACVRITSKLSGTVSGKGTQQGLDLVFAGTIRGTDVWYFAPKEGVFVKSTSEAVTEGTITVSGPQKMTIPMTQAQKSEAKLIGR